MKILTICIPTFNRRDLVLKDVKRYLSVKDERFYLKIVDNASTDGTFSALKEFESDPRFVLVENEENIFNIPNQIKALSNNKSEYSLLVLDKDTLNLEILPSFIDFLEENNPDFGFIDPGCGYKDNVSATHRINYFFEPGIKSLYKMAYLSKHPTGYFYKSRIFEEAKNSIFYKDVDPMFDFPYELMNSYLSLNYTSVIVEWPLIIRAAARGYDDKSKSYSKGALYFDYNHRANYYLEYLRNISLLNVSKCQRRKLEVKVTKDALLAVSIGLAEYWRDKNSCFHYHIEPRCVTYGEMYGNVKKIFVLQKEYVKNNSKLPDFIIFDYLYLYFRVFLAFLLDLYPRIKK